MMKYLVFLFVLLAFSCKKEDESQPVPDPNVEPEMYFPPTISDDWNTTTPESLNWNIDSIQGMYDFLEDNGTRAFIILMNGKIVIEQYWGNNILNTAPFDVDDTWYWASAGKTLSAALVGIAEQENHLSIEDQTSDYLGENWTNMPLEKESLIKIKHQLTMSTGLEFNVPNVDCTDPICLDYREDAGTQWFYHNAPYTLIQTVVSNAVGMTYNEFTDQAVESKIGSAGIWLPLDDIVMYWSTPRDAAKFGLLLLNEGIWDQTVVLNHPYFNAMTNTSQSMNESYGYLTWLNGKSSIVLPGLNFPLSIPLSVNAPEDCYAAMGKNGQFIDIIPSQNMVVIRMGDAASTSLVPTTFHNQIWEKINGVIN